jgi:DNA-binding GntR family transcriptional regulator
MLAGIRRHDADRVVRYMAEHLKGTEHVLAGLLPPVG